MDEIVTPKAGHGHTGSLHPGGPKWTITCGGCEVTFRERIPYMDYPIIVCPWCGVRNRIPLIRSTTS